MYNRFVVPVAAQCRQVSCVHTILNLRLADNGALDSCRFPGIGDEQRLAVSAGMVVDDDGDPRPVLYGVVACSEHVRRVVLHEASDALNHGMVDDQIFPYLPRHYARRIPTLAHVVACIILHDGILGVGHVGLDQVTQGNRRDRYHWLGSLAS